MNKYGKFEYHDYPENADRQSSYTASPLQEGADPTSISLGYVPKDFQTFEQGAYDTRYPKLLYDDTSLSFTSSNVSKSDGYFADGDPELTISFPQPNMTITVLTITSRNAILSGTVISSRQGTEVSRHKFGSTEKQQTITVNGDNVDKIVIYINKIDHPHSFAGIYKVSYGQTVLFGEEAIIDSEITSNFSLKGDTLPFDTLDMNLYSKVQNPNFIQRKQKLTYEAENGTVIQNFYIEQGVSKENNTINMMAYDEISNLNGKFDGGLWLGGSDHVTAKELIPNILNGIGSVEIPSSKDFWLTGYLPMDVRGSCLQKVLLSSGFRCFKSSITNVKPLETKPLGKIVDSDILVEPKPTIATTLPLWQLRLNVSRFSKGQDETEFYHWYVDTKDPVRFDFDQPLYDLKAYLVSLNDEGQEQYGEDGGRYVEFTEVHPNYCVIKNSYNGKLVLKGKNYSRSISTFTHTNPTISASELYSEVVINLDLAPEDDNKCQKLCDDLYDVYSKVETLKFMTLKNVFVGAVYTISFDKRPPKNYTIVKKVNKLNGTYEVEAV